MLLSTQTYQALGTDMFLYKLGLIWVMKLLL